MDESRLAERYQFQPLHVKLWRRRHLIRVPLDFGRMAYWACVRRSWFNSTDPILFRLRACWGIAHGQAHIRMKWFHTLEEVTEKYGGDLEEN